MPEFSLARTFRNRGLLLQTGSQFSNSALINTCRIYRLQYLLFFLLVFHSVLNMLYYHMDPDILYHLIHGHAMEHVLINVEPLYHSHFSSFSNSKIACISAKCIAVKANSLFPIGTHTVFSPSTSVSKILVINFSQTALLFLNKM